MALDTVPSTKVYPHKGQYLSKTDHNDKCKNLMDIFRKHEKLNHHLCDHVVWVEMKKVAHLWFVRQNF